MDSFFRTFDDFWDIDSFPGVQLPSFITERPIPRRSRRSHKPNSEIPWDISFLIEEVLNEADSFSNLISPALIEEPIDTDNEETDDDMDFEETNIIILELSTADDILSLPISSLYVVYEEEEPPLQSHARPESGYTWDWNAKKMRPSH
eukprot:TRINITY_DN5616_c0_g1_i1.p1 TRINITY_DN5616_c0_g1~~TRINITY_DN5616_c0_g1_i1.p1  ORF type:complete len:148 (+),score=28.17 TRINITY_DN5616_c0_g1_i1:84-527(+)